MKILARYLSSVFLKNFALSSFGLTALYLFQAILGELIRSDYPAQQIIYYYLLDVPQIYVQLTPPSVLMAVVFTLSAMSRSNELVACYSIGIGLRQVMTVILSMVFMIACFSLVLQDRILPPLFSKRTTYYWREMEKRMDFFLDVKQDKIWYRSQNLIYNLRSFDAKSKTIYGMSVYTFDDHFNLVQVVAANEAQHSDNGWKLLNGTVTVFTGEDFSPMSKRFEERNLVIPESPKDFQEIEKEVDGLRIKEMWRYITRTQRTGADTKKYETKLHSRISLSFTPMVMAALAIPFSTRRRREGGVAKDFGICLGMSFFYWIFHSVGLSLGTAGTLPPLLAAWIPSLIFLFLAIALIFNRRQVL